ncbi:MAG: hypothetical protein SV062_13045 [Thermodesulfobacteriota bacterium]|nr:hypothetical protein [Thermodesulfobacteriota bacterium]
MGFTVEQECPQCGAPIELDETDHLIKCPYCNVKNYLFTPNYFRFVLPNKSPDKEIIYAPYLRFKGNVYYCRGLTVGHRIVDITHVGLPFRGIPMSLGLRPQALKMKFVTPDTGGSFLRFSLKAADILSKAGKLALSSSSGRMFHRAYIGETLSLIYLPLFVQGKKLFDAVLNRPIASLSEDHNLYGLPINKHPRWKIIFMPTLCPQCGWNLEGERDSVVLICGNCKTAWEASKGKFIQVNCRTVPAMNEIADYLPFWKISVSAKGLEINSFADFIRVTNQPRVIKREWESQDVKFWIPAFKIRPKVFLQLIKRFTLTQKDFEMNEDIPQKNLYPVTLPQSEAAQSLKITLASSATIKKEVLPLLPQVRFIIKESLLIYLPFNDTGHEFVQKQMGIGINKASLKFGRQL